MSESTITKIIVPAMQAAIRFDAICYTDATKANEMKAAMNAAKAKMIAAEDARSCIKAGFDVVAQFNGDKAAYIATAKSAM